MQPLAPYRRTWNVMYWEALVEKWIRFWLLGVSFVDLFVQLLCDNISSLLGTSHFAHCQKLQFAFMVSFVVVHDACQPFTNLLGLHLPQFRKCSEFIGHHRFVVLTMPDKKHVPRNEGRCDLSFGFFILQFSSSPTVAIPANIKKIISTTSGRQ
jgi:hypothetical protein